MTELLKKNGQPRKQKPRPSLTPGEVAFVKGLSAGKTIAQAYKDACGAGIDPNHSGWQALRHIKIKVPEIMDSLGLTQESLINDHLKPLLEATEVKVFKGTGQEVVIDDDGNKRVVDTDEIIYSKPLVAWGPRKDALDISFRLHGSYARPADEPAVQQLTQIKIIIEDVSEEGKVKVLAQAD